MVPTPKREPVRHTMTVNGTVAAGVLDMYARRATNVATSSRGLLATYNARLFFRAGLASCPPDAPSRVGLVIVTRPTMVG